MIPVRWQQNEPRVTKVTTLPDLHPLIGTECPGCDKPILSNARIALVYVGPGNDSEARTRARKGQWHTGTAVVMHETCAK